MELTIIHEFLHYCIWRAAGKGCPVWLNEGLVLNLSGEVPLLDCTRKRKPYTIEELDRAIKGKDREKARQAYFQAAETVSKLLKKYGFDEILKDLKSGKWKKVSGYSI